MAEKQTESLRSVWMLRIYSVKGKAHHPCDMQGLYHHEKYGQQAHQNQGTSLATLHDPATHSTNLCTHTTHKLPSLLAVAGFMLHASYNSQAVPR